MTKADLVDEIAQRTGLTKKEVGETVDLFLQKIREGETLETASSPPVNLTARFHEGREADVRLGVGKIGAERVRGDLVMDISSGGVRAEDVEGSVLHVCVAWSG